MYHELITAANVCDKCKINALLSYDANLYANMGTDSTPDERARTKATSKKIYESIASLDPVLGSQLLVDSE